MRIKSSFKDYYDSAMGLGFDSELTYVRQVSLSNRMFGSPAGYGRIGGHNEGQYVDYTRIEVCFCGYIYNCIMIGLHKWGKFFTSGDYNFPLGYNCFYDIDSLDKYIEGQHKKVAEAYYFKKYRFSKSYRESFEDSLSNNGSKYHKFDDIQAYGCPILVRNGPTMFKHGDDTPTTVHNPPLKLYEFHRVKDAYACYQEINQFLSNVAHPNKPIPTVSDRDMIVAKGFDLRTSFRKEKKKKK
jgi:hypothetical protein